MIRASAITSKTVDFELPRKYVVRGDSASGFPITVKLPVTVAAGLASEMQEAVAQLRKEENATSDT